MQVGEIFLILLPGTNHDLSFFWFFFVLGQNIFNVVNLTLNLPDFSLQLGLFLYIFLRFMPAATCSSKFVWGWRYCLLCFLTFLILHDVFNLHLQTFLLIPHRSKTTFFYIQMLLQIGLLQPILLLWLNNIKIARLAFHYILLRGFRLDCLSYFIGLPFIVTSLRRIAFNLLHWLILSPHWKWWTLKTPYIGVRSSLLFLQYWFWRAASHIGCF